MDEKKLLKKIAQRIKEIRLSKGITQQELAAAIDYEKSNMSRMESGTVNLRIATLYKVAEALEVPVSDLLP
ncbi:helix-turn-helix domain-containing protein [Taibaiella soli]|uniref:XRE family transcriptional regulator n=1 Tax=Taibaiella soli TaxID=1649169 RepID=A0A2W2BXJ7_9BACT|nr:helix-turn-helix transcriptional regulator [Taibaiella soli]PZF72583.1 XRE family transcriptional regulator [Taibaiella soli]